MNGERQKNGEVALIRQEGKKKTKAVRQNGGSFRRTTTSSLCVTRSRTGRVSAVTFIRWRRYAKSSITPTDGSTTSVCGTRYRASKPIPPNASRKRKWTRRWRKRTSGWATTFRNIGIRASTSCALFGLGKTQVRRFALTHGVRTKRIHGNRLYYLKADWDAARKEAERKAQARKPKGGMNIYNQLNTLAI